jgi:hypothetical protein
VRVPGDEAIDAPVTVDPAAIALPFCESYVTVSVFAVHCAHTVNAAVLAGE